jgi:hypothetical protein
MMSARTFALTIAAFATVVACKKPAPPPEPPPVAPAVPAAVAAPAIEPPTAPEPAAANPDDEVSIPEDFEGEVAKAITPKNYKAELDKIDKEIAKTPE